MDISISALSTMNVIPNISTIIF